MLLQRKNWIKILLAAFFVLSSLLSVSEAQQTPKTQQVGKCPNEFPISGLLTDFCYKCFFPLRIGGIKVFSYGGIADDADMSTGDMQSAVRNFFSDANTAGQTGGEFDINIAAIATGNYKPSSPACICYEKVAGVPFPHFGVYVSFWDPSRLAEVLLRPGCFPTLFGQEMNFGGIDFGSYGDGVRGSEEGHKSDYSHAMAHYSLHYYSFPLMTFLDIIFQFDYCTDYISEFDLINFSEVDPTHNDDVLSVFINPEVFLVSNPIAQLICAVDSITSTIGYPLNSLFWCAGTWGSVYPLTGNHRSGSGDSFATGGLIISRGLAKMGRMGLELDTSGEGAKCGMSSEDWFANMYMPLLKKSQYRMQLLSPIPNTTGKCCHQIGTSTFLWGLGKNMPRTTSHQIYMLWRKRNCCLKLL